MTDNLGIIYVAIGKQYLHMATSSARSLKAQCPDIPIDVFTDQSTDDPVFDKIHALETDTRYSKILCMQRSRFDRTLFIDADTWIVADISDVFQILDRFDIAAAHDQYRNFPSTHLPLWKDIPNAFPQMNCGIIAFTKSECVTEFLEDWRRTLTDADAGRDQPAFRELLYLSDLRVATLPEEYNLMKYDVAARWTEEQCAPRIIHHRMQSRNAEPECSKLNTLADIVGTKLSTHIKKLLNTDRQFSKAEKPETLHPIPNYPTVRIREEARKKSLKLQFSDVMHAFINQKR